MTMRNLAVIVGVTLVVPAQPAGAGSCARDIERLQAQVDARIAAVIDTAEFAREARRAFGLPVPAAGPVAITENARREATRIGEAVAAMMRARQAHQAGDDATCANALADVQQAIGR